MGIELDKNQLEALSKLKSGSILYGGVGSGKSITAIAWYAQESFDISTTGPKDLYIITTAKKRDNCEWDSELTSFMLSRDRAMCIGGVSVVVDSWNNIKKYADVKDSYFIFDEQRLVGYGAWVKSFFKIAKHNKWILLTATPGDTWIEYMPIMIANGYYRNKSEFISEHVVYSRFTKFPLIVKYINTQKLERIREDILVPMKYEKHTNRVNLTVVSSYNEISYKKVSEDRWNVFDDCPIENVSQYCYLLRKVCNSDPSRINAIAQEFRNHNKVIIFYNYTYELNILRDWCETNNIPFAEWNGEKHMDIPKTATWVYLVQYSAGCEGWNCIETDTIFFYSQSYSYKQMEQASGRIDRRNTKYDILRYYVFTTESEIDKHIYGLYRKKESFNAKIFAERRF